jgi:hypothetical protein
MLPRVYQIPVVYHSGKLHLPAVKFLAVVQNLWAAPGQLVTEQENHQVIYTLLFAI